MIHDCHGKWLKTFRCFEDVAKMSDSTPESNLNRRIFSAFGINTKGIPVFAGCLALQPFLTFRNPTDACGS